MDPCTSKGKAEPRQGPRLPGPARTDLQRNHETTEVVERGTTVGERVPRRDLGKTRTRRHAVPKEKEGPYSHSRAREICGVNGEIQVTNYTKKRVVGSGVRVPKYPFVCAGDPTTLP